MVYNSPVQGIYTISTQRINSMYRPSSAEPGFIRRIISRDMFSNRRCSIASFKQREVHQTPTGTAAFSLLPPLNHNTSTPVVLSSNLAPSGCEPIEFLFVTVVRTLSVECRRFVALVSRSLRPLIVLILLVLCRLLALTFDLSPSKAPAVA
jgi:hypothetical protein